MANETIVGIIELFKRDGSERICSRIKHEAPLPYCVSSSYEGFTDCLYEMQEQEDEE